MIKQLLGDLLALFYPRICAGCGRPLNRGEQAICLNCEIKLPRTEFLFSGENPMTRLFWGRLSVQHASAFLYFRKSGITQKLMHQLKYKGNRELGHYLGYLYGRELKENVLATGPDLITTVPLHSEKLKKRGFNQSDEIALGFSEATGIPFKPNLLLRTEITETQTRKKRFERWENIENSFTLNGLTDIESMHIILVDDVVTTGATIEACGHVLTRQKGVSVSIISLCIAIN